MTSEVPAWARTGPIPYRSARTPAGWTLPGDARLALWIIPNIEFFPLDMPIPGGTGKVPDVMSFSSREYGARVGFYRVLDAIQEIGALGTATVNSSVVEAYPELVQAMSEASWEVMGHSITNSRRLSELSEEEEGLEIAEVTQTLTDAFGRAPAGWLGAGLTERWTTLDRLVENGYSYVADWALDDRPNTALDGALVTVPYPLEVNDKPAFDSRLMTPDEFAGTAIRTFDVLLRESADEPRVMAIALHPYLIGAPHRIESLRRLLGHMREAEGVWWTTGGEIASRYREETGR
ncbi:MAG: hypothetical protein JWP54_2648 [Cryobacterium sp.]|jgi:allantoinase|nr:hypothetical protein [Cryobacterium sp.]